MFRQPKSSLLSVLIILSAATAVFSQCGVPVLTGGSTSNAARAPNIGWGYGRSVYLIRASEMLAAGIPAGAITGIGWSYETTPITAGTAPLIIYLENTADATNLKSNVWATAITGMTVVHNAATTLPSQAGAFDVPFVGGSPFTYTGGGLYVAFDWGAYTGPFANVIVFCNTSLTGGLLGQQNILVPPLTLAVSNFRPVTRLMPAVPMGVANDAETNFVSSYGAIPLGLTPAQSIQGRITNNGSNVQTNLPATLTVTGPNSATDTQNITTLAACYGKTTVTHPFTPTNLGLTTLTESVPPDDVLLNNSAIRLLNVTADVYSYKYPGSTAAGGTGFAPPAVGGMVGKFNTTAPTQIDSIIVEFFAASPLARYRLAIYGDSAGTPGALLYLDAANRTVPAAGSYTLRLPAPVAVGPGDFYVGIHQTSPLVSAELSYDDEFPIRSGSFFSSTTAPLGPWIDFSPGAERKLNIGFILGSCLVPLTADVTPDGPINACVETDVNLTATPGGGSGNNTYQWTEGGINIGGATSNTYIANQATPGAYTYNVKITDGGGCVDQTDPTPTTVNFVGASSPAEVGPGPSPNVLEWTNSTTLQWPAVVGGQNYRLYRGTSADLPALLTSEVDSCDRSLNSATSITGLNEIPPPNDFYWYVVSAIQACGVEGTAGNATDGPRIMNSSGTCP